MKKYLGIDYGSSKIGLAISNSEDKFCLPYKILSEDSFWSEIEDIIESEQIDELVLGFPKNMQNEDTKQTEIVRTFSEKIKDKLNLPVHLEDERMTSMMGAKMIRSHGQKTKKQDDSAAATIILDSFIKRTYGF